LTVVAVMATAAYLAASRAGGFLGFPLDDAWIHQTYARNLAVAGEFAFVPGHPSAGSTSPAWTTLLAIGHALHLDLRLWTYALGAALLALNAWLAYRLTLKLQPEAKAAAWLAGLLVAVEWHLVWAAGSGMETLLFSAFALLVFLLPAGRHGFWLGLCAGASVLVRPDGLLLLPFALGRALAAPGARTRSALDVAVGFGAVFLPYLAFNQWLAGTAWPNTFYAKQAEYAVLRGLPLWQRLTRMAVLPFVGGQALLLPGLVWQRVCVALASDLPARPLPDPGDSPRRSTGYYRVGAQLAPAIAAPVCARGQPRLGAGGGTGDADLHGDRRASVYARRPDHRE
jgi:hypothetical protein